MIHLFLFPPQQMLIEVRNLGESQEICIPRCFNVCLAELQESLVSSVTEHPEKGHYYYSEL